MSYVLYVNSLAMTVTNVSYVAFVTVDHTLAGELLSDKPQAWYVERSTDALGTPREDTVRVTADISHLYRDGHDGHRSLSVASSTPCGAIAFMTHIKFRFTTFPWLWRGEIV